jgi:hypothetical protein
MSLNETAGSDPAVSMRPWDCLMEKNRGSKISWARHCLFNKENLYCFHLMAKAIKCMPIEWSLNFKKRLSKVFLECFSQKTAWLPHLLIPYQFFLNPSLNSAELYFLNRVWIFIVWSIKKSLSIYSYIFIAEAWRKCKKSVFMKIANVADFHFTAH